MAVLVALCVMAWLGRSSCFESDWSGSTGRSGPFICSWVCDDGLLLLQSENVNRQAEGEAARSVTDAISLLGVSGGKSPDVDAHPER